MNDRDPETKIDSGKIELLWNTFVRVGGVTDMDSVPKFDKPEHDDVKLILIMYSFESFLFNRLNQACRDKDGTAISTLGPYAVALTKVINSVQTARSTKINGPIICYRGLSLKSNVIEEWKHKKMINLDGFTSTTTDE